MNLLNILDKLSDDQFFPKMISRSEGIFDLANFGKSRHDNFLGGLGFNSGRRQSCFPTN
jgi:hypothetical protein